MYMHVHTYTVLVATSTVVVGDYSASSSSSWLATYYCRTTTASYMNRHIAMCVSIISCCCSTCLAIPYLWGETAREWADLLACVWCAVGVSVCVCARVRERERASRCMQSGGPAMHAFGNWDEMAAWHERQGYCCALFLVLCCAARAHACMPAFRIPMCTAAHHRLTTNGSHTITRPFLTPSLQKVHYRHVVFRQSLGRVAHHITSSSDRSTLRRSLLSALNLLAAHTAAPNILL
jgi:hypothetical protein